MADYTDDQGIQLVRAARSSIELQIRSPFFNPKMVSDSLEQINGNDIVSIKIIHHPTKTLRSFFTTEHKKDSIVHSVINAALTAAFKNPNTIPMSEKELDEHVIRLDILAEPVLMEGSYVSRLKSFELGKHGIIVEYGSHKSMLLPSYATDRRIDKSTFMGDACEAAGLPRNYWKQPNVKIYKFDTQTFAEENPNGNVSRI